MATQGLSLVGFMSDPTHAVTHLRNACIPNPTTKTDDQLIDDWNAAKERLGPANPKAGNPDLAPIDIGHPNIARLMLLDWAPSFQGLLAAGATFQMVEVDPLLAFQFSVDTERSGNHCAHCAKPPTEQEMFDCCLPTMMSKDEIHLSQAGQNLIIKSRSLNLITVAQGVLPHSPNTIGMQFNWTLPFVHVVRYAGRCYLHNGYHRAYGMRLGGATHVPCIFRDVATAEEAGISPDGHTFSEALLTSDNPPTLAHFAADRAMPVMSRRTTRILHVSWSQHTMYDE